VFGYDYLAIAPGYLNDFDLIPGSVRAETPTPSRTLEGAVDAAEGWARLLNEPGPGGGRRNPGGGVLRAKIALEKYFLWKARHGYVKLP
jgi:hypothetical protein